MEIIYNEDELANYIQNALAINSKNPLLIDRYMLGKEIEIDAISDGETVIIPGIMEHIEKAGVHSGDSIAVYPPQNLHKKLIEKLIQMTELITKGLNIKGLINIQFVIYHDDVFILEVNPRSSRTIPFLSKMTNIPMCKLATQAILGKSLKEQGYSSGLFPSSGFIAVKAPVFSFAKLSDVEIALGPEMKSTGEVMGRDRIFEKALQKAFLASGMKIPESGTILVTISDKNKQEALPLFKRFHRLGFDFIATEGTAKSLISEKIPVQTVAKIGKASVDLIDEIKSGRVSLIINTISKGKDGESDGFKMRRAAVESGLVCLTSLDTAEALLKTLERDTFIMEAL